MDAIRIPLDAALADSLRKALEVLSSILDDAAATTSQKLRAACTILRLSMAPPWSRPATGTSQPAGAACAPSLPGAPPANPRAATRATPVQPAVSPFVRAAMHHRPRPAFDLLAAAGASPPALAPPPLGQIRLKSATFS